MMNINPYEPSSSSPRRDNQQPPDQLQAKRYFRMALLILLPAAIYNFVAFNFGGDTDRAIDLFFRAVNATGFVTIALLAWYAGFELLELLTGGIHAVIAKSSDLNAWNSALYLVLRRAPFFAVGGCVLWALWVLAFYQLKMNFSAISVPVGIAANLWAAGLYLPLFFRWYRLERMPSATS